MSEEAFAQGRAEPTHRLPEALNQKVVLRSTLAARVLASELLYQSLMLAQESYPSVDGRLEEQHEPNIDQYWSRHLVLDNDLTSLFLILPESLRLPAAFRCQDAVFVNIIPHVAIICLHQSAIRRMQAEMPHDDFPDTGGTTADSPSAVCTLQQSRERMFAAAKEIQRIFGIVQDLEMALRNPMQDFAAYTAALVFLDRLSTDDGDEESRSSVAFLLDVLNIVGQTDPAAQTFATRLAADLEKVSTRAASNTTNART